jgi:hypothetical protein
MITPNVFNLQEKYSNNIIRPGEKAFLQDYADTITPLVAPTSEAWVGLNADWKQLHAGYGIGGELMELNLEVGLVPIVKEFGDLLFYSVVIITTVPSGWLMFENLIEEPLDVSSIKYPRIDPVTCMTFHYEVVSDIIKRKMFYGVHEESDIKLMRNLVNALVLLKINYGITVESFNTIFERLCNDPNVDRSELAIKLFNNDFRYFTNAYDLITIGTFNLEKLLKGVNARYASGKFDKQDALDKKDATPIETSRQ